MKAVVDAVGPVVLPEPLRDVLGLRPGSTVDVTRCGAGLLLVPTHLTARLVDEDGELVATRELVIDDNTVFGLLDAGRR